MDFIQRMIRYFAVVRRQLRRHRRLVVAAAAVVVFATTYALVLPAITLDENTADSTPGIELAGGETDAADATVDVPAEEEAEQPAEGAAATDEPTDVQAEATASEPADDEAVAEESPAPDDAAEADEATATDVATDATEPAYLPDGTVLEYDGDGYYVTAEVGAEAQLPEDTTLSVTEITPDAEGYDWQAYHDAALAKLQEADPDATELAQARFFDITFADAEGDALEPAADVRVTVQYSDAVEVKDASKVGVVHFDDETGEPSALADDKVSVDAPDDQLQKVEFTFDSFSVYGIVETTDSTKDKTIRRTYTFLNDDGSAYNFTLNDNPDDTTGEATQSTNTQIVKNGDTLQSVGTPEAKNEANQGREFTGWKVTAVSNNVSGLTVGEIVTLPQTVSGIHKYSEDANTDETVTLQATYDDSVYLTFYDSDNTTVIFKEKVVKDSVVNLSNYHAAAEIPASGTQMVKSFVGWNTTQDATEALANSYTAPADATFYPVYKEGYWLYFNANDADSTVKASFTESVFANRGETSESLKPTDPQRQGYTFGGWYTDANCTTAFTWGTSITANTTLYAKWTPSTTTYTVMIWRQRVTDDKGAEDSAKTYDYGESYQVSATTGDVISSSTDLYSGTGYDRQNLKSLSGGDYTGFHYASTGVTRTDTTTTVTVAGDGSSVINVYYDRDLITMNFTTSSDTYTQITGSPDPNSGTTYYGYISQWKDYVELYYRQNSYGSYEWYFAAYDEWGRTTYYKYSTYGDGNYYTRDTSNSTMTGLYGQPLSMYNYSWPADNGPWYYTYSRGNMYMSFLGQFVLPGDQTGTGNSSTTINFIHNGTNSKTYYFYLQNADGSWPLTPSATGSGAQGVSTFNFSEKFDNFNVSAYQLNNGGQGEGTGNWTSTQAGSSVSVSNASSLGVRYTRKQYNVEFYNGSTHLSGDVTKYYEASLSDVASQAPTGLTYPGNSSEAGSYEFVGWFADPEATTYVSFGTDLTDAQKTELQTKYPDITTFVTYETMPGHNLPVYAGWKAITHTVTFNPDGGTIPGVKAGQNYVETVLLGSSVTNATASNVQQTTYTDSNDVTYTLVGWYKVNTNGTETLYNFGDAVTEDITLKAHWRQSGQFYVRYVDGDDSDATKDNTTYNDSIAYADQSDVRVASWPTGWTLPTGKVFAGWQVTYTDTNADGTTTTTTHTYLPGETFTMEAARTTEESGKNYITLTATYTELGTTYVRYDINYTGGTGTLTDLGEGVTDNVQRNVPLNQTTTLSSGTGFTRTGYVLAGWNTQADGTGTHWNLGDKAGLDGKDGNTLYAEWVPIQKLKKVDNETGEKQKTLSGATFKLTKDNGSGTYGNVAVNDFYGTVTVGDEGYTVTSTDSTVDLGALKAGSYKLSETTAPAGYVISTSTVDFSVNDKGAVTFTNTDNASYDSSTHTFTIKNTPGEALPKTGGTGTLSTTIGGLSIAALALLGLALRRRSGRGDA